MARSCLKEMQPPTKMWGEAIRHSVYILNRIPTRALTGQMPYEVWYERKPNLSYVRVFGCLAYMKNRGNYVQKLKDRSKWVVNLGKEPGTNGYHFYDLESDRIYVNRDVTFEEMKSWPWNESGNEEDILERLTIMNENEENGDK